MANGMRKLLKYMKEHPPKNVELQRINVLESENARLREAVERNILPKYEEFNPPAAAMKAFQVYAKTVQELRADNARLREALKRIAFGKFQWRNKMVEIAIAALAGPEKKESKEKPIRANFPPFDHRNLGKRGGIE